MISFCSVKNFCIKYYYFAVIIFSDDNDGVPDILGERTGAKIELKQGMSKTWTICLAYMVEAWSGEFMSAHLFKITNDLQETAYSLVMSSENRKTRFTGKIGKLRLDLSYDHILFPLHLDSNLSVIEQHIRERGTCCERTCGGGQGLPRMV